ncbi:hypothetical protein CPB84DRAFT_1964947 [Gymnopilus junonius]|uniref:Uncharacterized protein n=1 Tax=Gymnopilus junonius TaxID=109634 RepID=A0A9P5TJR3_GYMJU|nr:hypothetical protein CPB84DRAFT_1964947 [Gymnopilus junonius]
MTTTFPQELVDIVVDNIHSQSANESMDNLHTLATCLLVSKSFNGPARRRLFSTMKLAQKSSPGPPRLRVLRDLLTNDDSDFPKLIKSLYIEVPYAWYLNNNTFVDLLHIVSAKAQNLSSFGLGGQGRHLLKWNDLKGDVVEAVRIICTSESIKCLELCYFNNVSSNLILGCSFTALKLTWVKFAMQMNSAPGSSSQMTSINRLCMIPYIDHFWKQIFHSRSLLVIATLELTLCSSQDLRPFFYILELAAKSVSSLAVSLSSLHSLEYYFDNPPFYLQGPKTIPLLPSLRECSFHLLHFNEVQFPNVHTIIKFLKHIKAKNTIQVLKFHLEITPSQISIPTLIPDSEEGLSELGQMILQETYPSLRKIFFQLTLDLRKDLWCAGYKISYAEIEFMKTKIATLFTPSNDVTAYENETILSHISIAVEVKEDVN